MMMTRTKMTALAMVVCFVATNYGQVWGADEKVAAVPEVGGVDAVWRDVTKTPNERARDLLKRLTMEEKIGLVHADGTFTTAGLPRFGIGKLWMSDGPQGVREEISDKGWNSANRKDDFATALPATVGLAASFDPELAKAAGGVIGEEAVVRGKNIMLCPGVNIMRTPLNGRNSEYLGEDPYLASRMAVGVIEGIQSKGVAACVKHFAMNNQEQARSSVNVHADERTMREIYLPAFKAAVTEGKVWSIMTAYNRVNGEYCSENEFLLNRVLKNQWGFQGLVMTDWSGCHSTVNAANHGLDLEMGSNVNGDHGKDYLATPLLEAVKAGEVRQERLDDMAVRNLRVMAATGLLDVGMDRDRKLPGLMAPAHIEVARKVAEAGVVLLKNEGVLPLGAGVKKVVVIGKNAVAKFAHDGNSAAIKTAYEVTALEGIQKRAGGAVEVKYVQGYATPRRGQGRRGVGGAVNGGATTGPSTQSALVDEAVAAAKGADVAIVVAGLYRWQDQEGQDRADYNLPPGQRELIEAVTKANPKTVVVLTGGSPSRVESWIGDAAGLMMYWYGGTEGGTALAGALFGDVNPSGKLPCSWPVKLDDSPAHANADVRQFPGAGMQDRTRASDLKAETGPQEVYGEGILVGYRWFDAKRIEPRFPFGFGLSYTKFEVSDLKVSGEVGVEVPSDTRGETRPAIEAKKMSVEVTVKNTGPREGAEVVQVYVGADSPAREFPRAVRELKGFKKVNLAPGGSEKVTVELDASAFAYFDTERGLWVAPAGDYTVWAGNSSRELPVMAKVKLEKEVVIREEREGRGARGN